ncbi:MAG: 5-guanidino-2-oxopentanoate decarboxylase [Boseongicola sp.]|nr:5-guanidino-2-oxopentanoate decarboxylase [Boseongicola sp.]
MLAARGVDTIFGIPGVHNVELYRGIEEAGIRHVLTRHEQGAGFMADGYARASGKPGVCFVISGPGLTNIMTPMGQAYSDSVPMIVISSCLDETAARKGQLHQMRDQEGAARTVCDWSETATTAEAAYELINRAFQEFHSERKRPKHIQIPIKVLSAPAPPADLSKMALSDAFFGDAPDLFQVIPHLLRQSSRPILILGGGAVEAVQPIRSVLDRCALPVFTTYAGRGIVPTDYPFLFGSMLARPDSASVLKSADLIIAVGTELSEVDLWRDHLGHDCRMVHVDIDNASLRNVDGVSMRFSCGSHRFFTMLDASGDLPSSFEWTKEDVAKARRRWRSELQAERPGILPVCDALSARLPDDTMIFSDMTQFAYAAKEVWDMPRPAHWHHPFGFGTLGYALPAAIGGALGHAGPVLAIAGDYGLQYTIQELGTASELGLSLPILVWDNNALGEIKDCMVRAQIAPNAVTLKNPHWEALAAAYDCAYAAPTSVSGLCDVVTGAFSANRPTLIKATPDISSSS